MTVPMPTATKATRTAAKTTTNSNGNGNVNPCISLTPITPLHEVQVGLGATVHGLLHLPHQLAQPGKTGDILKQLLRGRGHYVALVSTLEDALAEQPKVRLISRCPPPVALASASPPRLWWSNLCIFMQKSQKHGRKTHHLRHTHMRLGKVSPETLVFCASGRLSRPFFLMVGTQIQFVMCGKRSIWCSCFGVVGLWFVR